MPRKPLAAAVAEFNASREAKAVAPDGKRPQLNPVYVADTGRVLAITPPAIPRSTCAT